MLEGESRAAVRATTVRVRDQFVMARYGRTSRDAFRARASRQLYATVAGRGGHWVPFAEFVEATTLVCDMFSDGDTQLAMQIGAYGAEANMGFWRPLVYRMLTPAAVMSLAGRLWSHHYRGGELVASSMLTSGGVRGVRLRLVGFPEPHRVHCLSIQGWCNRLIELGSPRQVITREVSCRLSGDSICEFVSEWE